ncbi:glycosyl transferase family protein [Loktanella agnita]|uniref:glycosyl transferase family protein n=1 Tax=Loktanella agnita TaxID=287097 RepID=UPI003987192F
MKTALAPYVRILGRGANLSRSLTGDEAQDAMEITLRGDAAPEATGAMLMLMRMKGETADEIAGFVRAARATAAAQGHVALDWPSYAAGRTRGLPWFLLSAKLVAMAGYPVLLHGWNSHQNPTASVRNALPVLNIPILDSADFSELPGGIGYLPLETLSPALFDLLRLRDALGVRSCINTVLRVLNPTGAPATVQGVFHPPYRELQMDAGQILGQQSMTVLKGGGGEFERHPGKDLALFGLRDGQAWDDTAPALSAQHVRLAEGSETSDPGALAALWSGQLHDDFARAVVLGTADLALQTLGADITAAALWDERQQRKTA